MVRLTTTQESPRSLIDKSIIINQLPNMELKLSIGFEQLLSLANQLSEDEKARLVAALQKEATVEKTGQGKRQLDKYKDQIWMSDDFNEPLGEFKDYM